MQFSTVVSDGLLALACLAEAVWLRCSVQFSKNHQATRLAAIGALLLTAITAACGSLRYAGANGLIEWHRSLSNASVAIGLPLLALAALLLSRSWQWRGQHWILLLGGLGAGMLLAERSELRGTYGMLINAMSLGLLLLAGLTQWPRKAPLCLSTIITVLFLLAGLVVGTQGKIGPFLRVDLFHLLLMPAYVLIAGLMIVLTRAKTL